MFEEVAIVSSSFVLNSKTGFQRYTCDGIWHFISSFFFSTIQLPLDLVTRKGKKSTLYISPP